LEAEILDGFGNLVDLPLGVGFGVVLVGLYMADGDLFNFHLNQPLFPGQPYGHMNGGLAISVHFNNLDLTSWEPLFLGSVVDQNSVGCCFWHIGEYFHNFGVYAFHGRSFRA